MSDNDKNTCPVCFTRMRNINKTLTCPECGYKYCDHSRDRQDMFDTSHTHEPNYTTYTNHTASSQTTYNTNTTYSNSKTTYSRDTTSSGRTNSGNQTSKRSVAKVVKFIIAIYLIMSFGPMICAGVSLAATSVMDLFVNKTSSNLPARETETVDLPDIGIDYDAPISLDAEDGEFVPELIKHMFEVSDWRTVTNEEIFTVYSLTILRNNDNNLCVYYSFNDWSNGQFEYSGSELDTGDLNVFIGLKYLYSRSESFEAGALTNLPLLKTLECGNTPAQVAEIVVPSQITELQLYLPDGTTSLEGLEQFVNVESLYLDTRNSCVTNAKHLSELPNLKYLSYCDNYSLESFDFLNELPSLRILHLEESKITDLNFVKNMSQLKTLSLMGSRELEDLTPLNKSLSELTSLDLSECTAIEDFSPISDLTSLNYLYLSNCNVADLKFMSSLKNLETLTLTETSVTSLEPLKDLTNLENIYLWGSKDKITDFAGLEDICN